MRVAHGYGDLYARSLPERPEEAFTSSLEGKVRRAIDLREREKINEPAFEQLIRAAVRENSAVCAQASPKKRASEKRVTPRRTAKKK